MKKIFLILFVFFISMPVYAAVSYPSIIEEYNRLEKKFDNIFREYINNFEPKNWKDVDDLDANFESKQSAFDTDVNTLLNSDKISEADKKKVESSKKDSIEAKKITMKDLQTRLHSEWDGENYFGRNDINSNDNKEQRSIREKFNEVKNNIKKDIQGYKAYRQYEKENKESNTNLNNSSVNTPANSQYTTDGSQGGPVDSNNETVDDNQKLEKLKAQGGNENTTNDEANGQNVMSNVVTGVSTAAMGVGGMQLAQGLAEQKADKEATEEMKNYLSNLYCTYSNKKANYGDTGITLNNENKLDLLREEFFNKAAQLKYTKEQLGIKAGIESQVVLDEKTTGLYENRETGRADSKFGRLSEALMDESGNDAQIIAAQQEKSKNRVTGGAIAVVGGIATSIGGNALLNSIENKQADELELETP